MEIVAIVLLGALFSWISLVILIAIGQGLADLSVPPWPETLWKLAVVAIVTNSLAVVLPINPILANLIIMVVFWTFMVKWFQVDFLGAVILVLLSWVIRLGMMVAISGLLQNLTA